jgi:hypothetical protein
MGTVTQYNLSNVQSALGGTNPISMNEYYRGGSFVPTTRTVTTREPSSGDFYSRTSSPLYYWSSAFFYNGVSGGNGIYWNSSFLGNFSGTASSVTIGSFTYFKTALVERLFSGYGTYDDYHRIYRTSTSTVSINTGVPSSGQISISQLFGAENP